MKSIFTVSSCSFIAWNVALLWVEEELSLNAAACLLALSFPLVMAVPFYPFRYSLGGQTFLPDIFHTIPNMLNRSICWQLWDILCPWLALLLTEESTSLSLWPSESRSSFPSEFSTFSGSLVQVSPSLQGFPAFFIKPRVWFFLEWWLPLGCCHLQPWLWAQQRSARGLPPMPPQ